MNAAQKASADLIESFGRKHGHELSSWSACEVRFETPPPAEANVSDGAKLRIECASCGVWAALVNDAGVLVTSVGYDQDCPGPERLNAA